MRISSIRPTLSDIVSPGRPGKGIASSDASKNVRFQVAELEGDAENLVFRSTAFHIRSRLLMKGDMVIAAVNARDIPARVYGKHITNNPALHETEDVAYRRFGPGSVNTLRLRRGMPMRWNDPQLGHQREIGY